MTACCLIYQTWLRWFWSKRADENNTPPGSLAHWALAVWPVANVTLARILTHARQPLLTESRFQRRRPCPAEASIDADAEFWWLLEARRRDESTAMRENAADDPRLAPSKREDRAGGRAHMPSRVAPLVGRHTSCRNLLTYGRSVALRYCRRRSRRREGCCRGWATALAR